MDFNSNLVEDFNFSFLACNQPSHPLSLIISSPVSLLIPLSLFFPRLAFIADPFFSFFTGIYKKKVTIQDIDRKRVVFKGERKVVPSCLILVSKEKRERNKACRTRQYSYCKGIPGCVPREIT